MKITWAQIGQMAAIITILGAVLGWVVNIERRISSAYEIVKRVKNLEDQLYPILVDHRVHAILGEMPSPGTFSTIDSMLPWDMEPPPAPSPPMPGMDHEPGYLEPPSAPLPYPGGDGTFEPAPPPPMPDMNKVREEAEVWAQEQLSPEK